MYEIEKNSYTPKTLFAGPFPVVTEIQKVKTAANIEELTPVALKDTGIEALTAENVADIYGITANAGKGGEEIAIYLTGEFRQEDINFSKVMPAEKCKNDFRKIGIFIR